MKVPYTRALVTGASSGIGREFARLLAGHGVPLVVVARREAELQELADELRDRAAVEVLVADLTREKDLAAVEDRLAASTDPVDLLVNNAGAAGTGAFVDLDVDDEAATVALNVIAPMRLMHAALRAMRAAGRGGGVLNISSMTGAMPMPRSATYGASKAFLTALSESVHLESVAAGVHVTSVEAGLTRTGFHAAAGIDTADLPKIAWQEPAEVAAAGLAALVGGRVRVVPGRMNIVQGVAMRCVPRPVLRRMVARMFAV